MNIIRIIIVLVMLYTKNIKFKTYVFYVWDFM